MPASYSTIPCAHCATLFTPRFYNQIFCTRGCYASAHGASQSVQKAANRANGLCSCGAIPQDGFKECLKCKTAGAEKISRQRADLRAQNLCGECREPSTESGPYCAKCKPIRNQRNVSADQKLRTRLLEAYGHACSCCGEKRREFLALDHIYGRANDHPKYLSGSGMCRWIAKQGFPKDKYRLLCHNCNFSRGVYGHCPHEREREELLAKAS